MTTSSPFGIVPHPDSSRPTDYLYRVSIKCLIFNDAGEILVVRETGRDFWDLPGGGMDHGESLHDAIAREMFEEVQLTGEFTYQVVDVDEPRYLAGHNLYQLRLAFVVAPAAMTFAPGVDADEVMFVDPQMFETSDKPIERKICDYVAAAQRS